MLKAKKKRREFIEFMIMDMAMSAKMIGILGFAIVSIVSVAFVAQHAVDGIRCLMS